MSRGRTVLIVEDDPEVRDALAEMIDAGGFEVVGTAANGNDALEAAISSEPDVAVLDYQIPGIDGITLAESMAQAVPRTQVIMLTAYDDTSLGLEARAAGIYAFLVKGSPPAHLLKAIDDAISRKRELNPEPHGGLPSGP
jgi:DNA-binding NarL/FixJ family response regulator